MSNAHKTTPVKTVGRVSPEGVTRQLACDAENTNVGLRDNAANPTYGAWAGDFGDEDEGSGV